MNSGSPDILRAVGFMLVAMSLIPLGDTAGKLLSNAFDIEVWFIAWSRFLIGFGALLLVLVLQNNQERGGYASAIRDYRVWLRGIFIVSAICSILMSLTTEPIANVFAAFFIGPIVSYFGASFILKETITPGRTILLALGFVGVLLVVKPGFSDGYGIYFALLAGTFYGCFLIANRLLAPVHAANTLLLSQFGIGSLLLLPLGLQTIPLLSQSNAVSIGVLVLVSALGSAGGNMLLLLATRFLGASRLAPLVYFQLVAATLLGMLVFGDRPDWIAWCGIVTIVCSGMASFVFLKETTVRN